MAGVVALVSITLVIAYFSLVLGELAPKRLALQRAEGFSLFVAPVIDVLATASHAPHLAAVQVHRPRGAARREVTPRRPVR